MIFFIYFIYEEFKFVLWFGIYYKNIIDRAQIAAGLVFNGIRHFSYVTKSRIFKNLILRRKADRNFRGTFLKTVSGT